VSLRKRVGKRKTEKMSNTSFLRVFNVIARHEVPKQSLKGVVRLLRFARNDR